MWPKYWSFSFSISPSSEYSEVISFRIDRLDLLVVQGTFKSLLQHPSSKASILLHSAFLIVQLVFPLNVIVIQVCAPNTDAEEAEVDQFYEDLQDLQHQKQMFFSLEGTRMQEIPGVTDKFGLAVQNEAGQSLTFCQENALVIANTHFQEHKR